MAKKKMTLEEKLEEAIVKDSPYDVPENWVWVNSLNILDIAYGKNLSTKMLTSDGYPVFGANGYIGFFSKYNIEKDRILISCRGAYSGTVNIANKNSFVTNNSLVINQKDERISNMFLFYMLKAMNRDKLVSGTAQPQVTVKAFEIFDVVLPPLKEQQRIVDKIECLFEKLDKAKELIEEARDDFEKRKSAILENAVRGELTKAWRNKKSIDNADDLIHDIKKYKQILIETKVIRKEKVLDDIKNEEILFNIPETWRWVRLGEISIKITDGTHKTPNYLESGIPFLSAKDIKNGKLTFEGCKFISDKEYNEINNRCNINIGTILVSKSGTIGNVTVVDEQRKFGIFESLAVINLHEQLDSNYIAYVLKAIISSNKNAYIKGTGVKHLHLNVLKNIIIPIPGLKEQKEIVRILDKLLEEESKIEELTALEEQIELIKKSILAKAFRGELGTNCEDDESALELLKEILNK